MKTNQKKEERIAAARVYMAENGFAELLGNSKVLNKGLRIAAGIKEEQK